MAQSVNHDILTSDPFCYPHLLFLKNIYNFLFLSFKFPEGKDQVLYIIIFFKALSLETQ